MNREYIKNILRTAKKYQTLAEAAKEGSYLRGRHHGIVDACYQNITDYFILHNDMNEIGKAEELNKLIVTIRMELDKEEDNSAVNNLLKSAARRGALKSGIVQAAKITEEQRKQFLQDYTAHFKQDTSDSLVRVQKEAEELSRREMINVLTGEEINHGKPIAFRFE